MQLFATLHESSTKVETTAAIGDNLHKVTGALNQLMSGFTFESINVIEPTQNEKRTYPRATNRLLVEASQNGKSFECASLDFSLAGMRLAINQKLDNAGMVELAVCLPQDDLGQYKRQNPLKLRGRVSWQRFEDGKNQCGITFEGMSDEANRKLRDCFKYYNKAPEFRTSIR